MKRRRKDAVLNGLTYISSGIGVLILASIIIYLLVTGLSSIDWHLLTSDYYATTGNAAISADYVYSGPAEYDGEGYYSEVWGLAVIDYTTTDNEPVIMVDYVDEASPFSHMYSTVAGDDEEAVILEVGQIIANIYYIDEEGTTVFLSQGSMGGAEGLIDILDSQATAIASISYKTLGGGIRGSIIATLYLIAISLLISLPIGIMTAIYLHEYAAKTKVTALIRRGIDTLVGVPSIIYGLMGVTVLFPITQVFGATSTSILLGGLTLAIILLPTIISSTEEALIVVPQSLRDGSLSLGATKSQTIFKVVLPSAMNGILTGVLLGIGRVIGESAALVYTTSTVINDDPSLLSQGTSLSLMIWSIMSGEQPDYELAAAISIIILAIVFVINGIVKLISKRLTRSFS